MKMKIVYVGIMSREAYKERTIAIAKGEYKRKKNEPKIWFESLKSMAQVLSSENRRLLKTILKHKPSSLADLEEMTGRKKSNLSRTLKTLERYGIVELHKEKNRIIPEVKATNFRVEFGLDEIAA